MQLYINWNIKITAVLRATKYHGYKLIIDVKHKMYIIPCTWTKFSILLHVWGFLGKVTWALSRNNAVVYCYVSLATQQFKRSAYPQHCCARDNSNGDVSMVTGLLSSNFYWFSQSCLEIAECRRACVFGYRLRLVGRLSSYREIAREAREFIPWTVKTVDRRG
jgi:hypothetical protein